MTEIKTYPSSQPSAHAAAAALALVALSIASSERASQLTAAAGAVKQTDLLRGLVAHPGRGP